jgi:hypothetical protein
MSSLDFFNPFAIILKFNYLLIILFFAPFPAPLIAPLEGTPPAIPKAFAFKAPLIEGPPPEGICILEEAGKFGVDFIFFNF